MTGGRKVVAACSTDGRGSALPATNNVPAVATATEVTVLKSVVGAFVGALVALALGAGPAHAQAPDPLAPGPYGYKKIEYSAGNLMITIPPANGTASQTFPQPLEGSIIYPD